MNQITHWLDSSNVYGSDKETQQRLRLNRNGLLLSTITNDGEELLPDDKDEYCRSGICMLSGDVISNVLYQSGISMAL